MVPCSQPTRTHYTTHFYTFINAMEYSYIFLLPFRTKLVWVLHSQELGTICTFPFLVTRDHIHVFVLYDTVCDREFPARERVYDFRMLGTENSHEGPGSEFLRARNPESELVLGSWEWDPKLTSLIIIDKTFYCVFMQ